MPAREERHEHELDDLVLPDDAHRDGVPEFAVRFPRHLQKLDVVRFRLADLDGRHAGTANALARGARPVKVC